MTSINSRRAFSRAKSEPSRCHLADESMQSDAISTDRWIAFVRNRFAIEQCEGEQRRHGLIKAVIHQSRDQRLAEFFSSFREQVQRNRLRRE